MRPRTVIMVLALGLAAYAVVRRVRRRRRAAWDSDTAPTDRFARADPRDPVQGFDEAFELQGLPLEVDAQSQADAFAAEDLARLEAELAEQTDVVIFSVGPDALDGVAVPAVIELGFEDRAGLDAAPRARRGDAGDLYGAHTPSAVDRAHLDDDRAFADGQNWLEALETSAIEDGADPERELDDIIDDEDVLRPPHAVARRDTPVADHGAGGRRGL